MGKFSDRIHADRIRQFIPRWLLAAVCTVSLVAVGVLAALTPQPASANGAPGMNAGARAATAGCGKAPTLTSGTRSIQSGGQNRSYILRVPDNYDMNRPYRLIFGYHWNGGTAGDVDSGGSSGYTWSYYGLRAQANNSTIFVAPQGINNGWANSGGADLTFTDDMIRQIEDGLCVDTTQLFAMGFSYGGGMSYAIACARPTVFRAVAVYSGAQLSGCNGGTQPIAYMGLHGLRDNVLNISLGRSLRDTFVRNNGCTAQNPPEPAQGSLTHIVTAYSGCRSGYPVVWAAFDGGHTPGPVDGSTADDGARTWTKAEVWKFFTQFQGTTPSPTSPTPPLPTSWVRINNVTSGLVLDSGGNVASGSVLKQWNYDGSTNLQWQLVDAGNGYYRIVNRTNGMVADSWGNAGNGASARQAAWNGANNQQWRFNDLGNGRYQIINRGTGTALDGAGSSTAGSTTVLWAPNSSTNNQWTVTAI